MSLKGLVAVVTGAAQGIGAAVVLELARQGATVIGTDINEAGAERIKATLAEIGAQGRGIVMDVRDTAQVDTKFLGQTRGMRRSKYRGNTCAQQRLRHLPATR